MILKLVSKDIKTFRKVIMISFFPGLIFSSFMVTVVDRESWLPYIAIGCAAVSFVIGYCFLYEKFRRIEIVTCSLPVKRTSILLAKYFTAASMAFAGMGIWFLNAVILNLTIATAPTNFYWFLSPYTWLIIVFYFTLLISFLMPIIAGLDRLVVIAILIFACAFLFVEGFHYVLPLISSDSSIFTSQSLLLFSVLTLLIFTAPYISLNLSAKIFNSRDL